MARTSIHAVAVFGLASALTAVVAWPVVTSPTRMIFGHEIVGRHHDPFTVMHQIAGTGPPAPYIQPVTDWTGWLLARVLDPVAAYNVLILLTFPLTAVASYALARYLRLPHVAALVAALLFAFAPAHVAHAAYHPHIAQTQWLPLYLLALFAMVDRPSLGRALGLAVAGAALVLSNFYMGPIGAVATPVALVGYWWASPRGPRRVTTLWVTAGVVIGLGVLGLASIALAAPQVLRDPSTYGVQSAEVSLYSARWWAYFVPPVTHVVLGPAAAGVFAREGISSALVEQQIYIGYALLALAIVAGVSAVLRWPTTTHSQGAADPPAGERCEAFRPNEGEARVSGRIVLVLWALAAVAALVSIGPMDGACGSGSWAPACHMYAVAPVFRAYARFAVVVHLALALAAGAGLAWLTYRSRVARLIGMGLVVLAAFEYWPLPAHARDVLPTRGHRWLADGAPEWRTLDCVALEPALYQVPWLMRQHVDFLGAATPSCRDPYLGPKLAARGYTHVLVRQPDRDGVMPLFDRPAAGVTRVATFSDAHVYLVTAPVPDVVVVEEHGFFAYEFDPGGSDFWRWMGPVGRWTVRNTVGEARTVVLSIELNSVGEARQIEVTLGGRPAGSLPVGIGTESHVLGPWRLAPGDHQVVFTAGGEPFRPSRHGPSDDDRDLTTAFRQHRWMETNERIDFSDDRAR